MRRVLVFLVTVVVGANLIGPVEAGRKAHQVVKGSILINIGDLPNATCDFHDGFPQAITEGAFPTGITGYSFWVDKATHREPFVLKPEDPSIDLDIFFHTVPDQVPVRPPLSRAFRTRGPGGERGRVPPGFHHATVCAQSGVDVAFTYTAGFPSQELP